MRRFRVLNKRGVHSMSAGRSWYLNQFVFEGEVPERLIDAWIADGAVVEEFDEPEPVEVLEDEPESKPRSRKPKAGA